jgi:hypothetical protein
MLIIKKRIIKTTSEKDLICLIFGYFYQIAEVPSYLRFSAIVHFSKIILGRIILLYNFLLKGTFILGFP